MEKFKKRNNISKFKITGEAASVSPNAVKAARERSKKVILEFAEKYGWHNVWNLDETALFYNYHRPLFATFSS